MMLGITNYLKHVNCVAKIFLVNQEYFSEFCLQRKYGAVCVMLCLVKLGFVLYVSVREGTGADQTKLGNITENKLST